MLPLATDNDCRKRIEEIKQAHDIGEKDRLITALGDMGSWAQPCLPLLFSLLKDPLYNGDLQLMAAFGYAVDEIQLGPYVAAREFLDLLDSSIEEIRHWPLGVLAFYLYDDYFPYITAELVAKIIKMLPETRPESTPVVVTQLLGNWYPDALDKVMGVTAKGISHWEEASEHGSMKERIQAIIALSVFGERGVPRLTRLFGSNDFVIRSCILWACSLMGDPVNELLIMASNDPDPKIKKLATAIMQCRSI